MVDIQKRRQCDQRYYYRYPEKMKAKQIRRIMRGCPDVEIEKAISAWEIFDGICQACGTRCSNQFDTDHDHHKKIFRGILGTCCNRSLGLLKDDPNRLRALLGYLERVN